MLNFHRSIPLNTMTKNYSLKVLFQGNQTGLSFEKCKMSAFALINKSINFLTELIEKPTNYDLLFFIATQSPKNDHKHPYEI